MTVIRRPFCETGRVLLRLNVMMWKWRNGHKNPTSKTFEHEHWHLRSKEVAND